MGKIARKFEKVFIDTQVAKSDLARRALKYFSKDRVEIVDSMPFQKSFGELSAEEFDRSKRNLYLTRFEGQFFKRCPGARPGLACCNYFVLNWGQQCDMNCSYCYLQSFINTPVTTLYTNIDQALDELREIGDKMSGSSLRIGTGEVVDSLSLDHFTSYSTLLADFIADYPMWTLEFKTKSNQVENLLSRRGSKNILVSWSINPQQIIDSEEHGTASLQERLEAAAACAAHGYKVSFHIDPMIYHADWKENYSYLINEICQGFTPEQVPVMSVGALRYQPEQRHIMRERFGMDSLALRGEMFQGYDGKLRYDQNLRQEMFDFVLKLFKNNDSRWNIFMCMETPETWLKVSNSLPHKMEELNSYFDPKLSRNVEKARSI